MSEEGVGRRDFLEWIFLVGGIAVLYAITESQKNKKIKKYASMTLEEARTHITTPEEANWYCNHYLEPEESGALIKSPEITHKERKADCGERALMAYYLLSNNGYQPTFLEMYYEPDPYQTLLGREELPSHLVFYQEISETRLGRPIKKYIVISDLHGLGPYNSLEGIVSYGRDGYRTLTLNTEEFPDWVTTKENLSERFDRSGAITWLNKRSNLNP